MRQNARERFTIASLLQIGSHDCSLHNCGFTLIELLVVISLIGVLAIGVITLINPVLQFQKVHDARRKSDLKQITTLLNLYYNDHGRYPSAGSCADGISFTSCHASSTGGTGWISALVPQYVPKLPVDPLNNADNPWITGNYSYMYSDVSTDGQKYNLTAQLENPSDPDRCGVKNYSYGQGLGNPQPWCGQYSNQIYEDSPF